jgi:hypothetical protein
MAHAIVMAEFDNEFPPSRFESNKRQFDGYCSAVFDYRVQLDEPELEYVLRAFTIIPPAIADEAPISWKTYGHKIANNRVAGWQLGIGFQTLMPDDRRSVLDVLARWLGASCLSPYRELLARSQGAGLGWVFPQQQRRLYFLCDGSRNTAGELLDARHRPHLAEISLPEFLLGYTFHGSTLAERKTYYYPLRSQWQGVIRRYAHDLPRCQALSSLALRLALVVSHEGEPRLQFDISPRHRNKALWALNSSAGVDLARACAALVPALGLDTIAVTRDGAGLYFD